jgi:hypothetical protein
MDAGGVPRAVTAFLLTDRSTCNIKWSEEMVGVLVAAWRESQTRTPVTASQATALMDEYASDYGTEPDPQQA